MNKIVEVESCSACGKNHKIDFKKLDEPKVIKGEEYNYSGKCENSNRTVYMTK